MSIRICLAERRLAKILSKDQTGLTIRDEFNFYISKTQVLRKTLGLVALAENEKVFNHYRRKFTAAANKAFEIRNRGRIEVYSAK